MNLRDLAETLSAAVEELADDENPQVRLAMQPNYPMEYSINDATMVEVDGKDVMYIAEGSQIGYLNGAASDVLGW